MGELIAGRDIRLTCVYDYFDPLKPGGRDIRTLPWDGRSIRALTGEFHTPRSIDGYEIVASINGTLIDPASNDSRLPDGSVWDLVPPPGSSLVFALVPQGGNGRGGKNPLATIAMLAVIVVSAIYAPQMVPAEIAAMGTGYAAAASMIIQMGMVTAGGLLINAILPPGTPDDAPAGSPTYGWQASGNPEVEGGALPVLHGVHRVKPPRIGKYITTEGDKQTLNLLFAVAGCALDDISAVEINDTPAADYNDPESETPTVVITTRLGTNDQEPIPEFLDTISETPIGAKLSDAWTTRQTVGNACDALGVSIIFPAGLTWITGDGDYRDQRVGVEIQYQRVGDLTWTPWTTLIIEGYQQSAIRRYARKDNLTPGQYSIRFRAFQHLYEWTDNSPGYGAGELVLYGGTTWKSIERDPNEVKSPPPEAPLYWEASEELYPLPIGRGYMNDVYWESLQEILYDDFIYPGVSLLALKIVATDKLMGAIPTVTCLATRTNVTVWDGAQDVSKPANLPPWSAYDLLRNEEYGGAIDKARIVYADLAAWADWCTAEGLTSNIYFDTGTNMRKALDTVSLLGRGVVIQRGSRFTCIVDKPEDLPVQRFLFTAGNIIRDSFQIDWLPYEGRANAIEVTYYDAEQNYSRQSVLLTSHDFETTDRPAEPTALNLVGCTSRPMAIRHGTAQLKRNRYLTMMPSWTAAVDSLGCMPGDVVEVAHDRPQWGISGRAVSAAASAITLDRPVTLEPGTTYMVTVLHAADDSREERYVETVEESTTTAVLTLTEAWTTIPAKYDQYSFGEEGRVTQLVRIGRITRSQQMRRRITALEYIDAAYDDDATIGIYVPTGAGIDVANLQVMEIYKYNPSGIGFAVASLTWRGQALQWQVFYRTGGATPGPWILAGRTTYPSYEIAGLIAGRTYDFTATSTGKIDPNQIVSLAFSGAPGGPAVPGSFTASLVGQFIELAWPASLDTAVKGYSVYLGEEALVTNYQGNKYIYRGTLTAGEYNFTLKAVDAYGQESEATAAASITILVPSTPGPAVVAAGELAVVSWASCKTSLAIDHYEVNTVAVGNSLKYSERITWTEKEFSVVAVDVAGNTSAAGAATLTLSTIPTGTGITATGLTYAIRLDLTFEMFAGFDAVEIWAASVNNRANAVKVGESAAPVWTHNGLPLIATRYYWIRIRDKFGSYGAWYPESATAGVSGSTSTDPTGYLTILIGSITDSQLFADLHERIGTIDTRIPDALLNLVLVGDKARTEDRSNRAGIAHAEFLLAEHATDLEAEASARLSLAAAIIGEDGTAETAGIIYEERLVRVTAEGALASSISALQTAVGNNTAAIQNEAYTRADHDGAIAGNVSTLSTTVGGHTATISAHTSSINGLSAAYTLKLNVNGRIAGFGLALSEGAPSEFIILADKFAIVSPNDNDKTAVPFVVGNVNGVSTVGITGNAIIDGSLLARNVGANEIIANVANIKDAIVETAKIKDLNVTTLKIADNAVTIPVSAYTADGVSASSNVETTIQSVGITTTGSPVFINFSFGFGTLVHAARVSVYRDSTEIYAFELNIASPLFSANCADTPSAAAHTYYLKITDFSGSNIAYYRSLSVLAVKK
jgi:predicted phage tail protein